MADDDVETLLKQQASLESNRSNFENWWQSIAERVSPGDAVITVDDSEGTKRTERMFDSSPATALVRFSAIVEDLMTPRTQVWNTLVPPPALADDRESKECLEEINKRLYTMRYRPKANFAENRHMCYKALGAFGHYALMIHDQPGEGACYEFIHPRESYLSANAYGLIDLHHRKFKLSARAVAKLAKDQGWELPETITKAVKDKPFDKFEFLHVIRANEEQIKGRADYRGWAWSSYMIAVEAKHMCKASGYQTWPLAIGRYNVAPGEVYARSPAMECWPAILTLNEQKKTVLKAGQKAVDPPMLLADDDALDPFDLRSSALNYGMMTADGQPLAMPLQTGGDVRLGVELAQLERAAVDDSFLTTIFKVLVDNPQMTATQVLEIARERAVLLAPTMGRLHSEDLGQLIPREIQILASNGMLPEIPEQLAEAADHYEIQYQSSLARALRANDAVAILRTMEAAPTFISLDPNSAYVIDAPAAYREVAEINGVPAKLVRDQKMVAKLAADAAQADQMREMVAAAPDVSTAVLNSAKAAELGRGGAAA